MAFAFAQGFPFDGERCFVRSSGPGGASCRASASAFAGPGCGSRGGPRGGCSVRFGNSAAREFDVVDTPEGSFIYWDASGFSRDDVKITVSDGQLRLSANNGEGTVVAKSWALSDNVLQDGISAKFGDNNELTITLPKVQREPKASFDVPIETGEQPVEATPANSVPEASGAAADADVDGSWVEVADEEVMRAKEKAKAPADASVLEGATDEKPGPSHT